MNHPEWLVMSIEELPPIRVQPLWWRLRVLVAVSLALWAVIGVLVWFVWRVW